MLSPDEIKKYEKEAGSLVAQIFHAKYAVSTLPKIKKLHKIMEKLDKNGIDVAVMVYLQKQQIEVTR